MKKVIFLISIISLLACVFIGAYAETSENAYRISGYVKPDLIGTQGISNGFIVKVLSNNKELPYSAISSSDGYFEIENIPENLRGYTLKFSREGYLERDLVIHTFKSDIDLSSKSFFVEMLAGDISIDGVQDGTINILDAVQMAKCFNSTSSDTSYNISVDFNKDKIINMSDLMPIALHFNSTKSSYNPNKILVGSIRDFYIPQEYEPIPEFRFKFGSVTEITSSSAILNASIYVHDYTYTVHSAYWEKDNPSLIFLGDSRSFYAGAFLLGTNKDFSIKISGLKKNTQYGCALVLDGPGIRGSGIYTSEITTLDK
ncbi:dockerin type I domain-containing protein [Pseudobacteroides cellulosolvens]|uniref:Dockerin domain-containing protein n=1 Tax=Pseudobacteroides cellulosolvens ATCC 35603 = DSM 2933 TaxID=398512 RepID=A0A0L6JHV6_9FIRM|nr:dockerin type I domain-containing protein [Pseudobacteroides cellulosolvens]KNY25285.1 hypothetical protein Bccel_0545 [Pseudobacteroides cellulosolvens ATCC 35603 = DSM 2933]